MRKPTRNTVMAASGAPPPPLSRLDWLRINKQRAMDRFARSERGTPEYDAALAEIEENAKAELELRMARFEEMLEV